MKKASSAMLKLFFIHSFIFGTPVPIGSGLEQAHQALPVLSVRRHLSHVRPWNAKPFPTKTGHVVAPVSPWPPLWPLADRDCLKHAAC